MVPWEDGRLLGCMPFCDGVSSTSRVEGRDGTRFSCGSYMLDALRLGG